MTPAISPTKQATALVVILILCFAAAGLGSVATTPNIPTWYATLAKPSWNPPNWLFDNPFERQAYEQEGEGDRP